MANTKKASGADQPTDVESHSGKTDAKVIAAAAPSESKPKATPTEDDVEGHNFGHNAMISRSTAQTREREIQHHLRDHDTKTEARRPFFKRGK
jgi:hypothetical protein